MTGIGYGLAEAVQRMVRQMDDLERVARRNRTVHVPPPRLGRPKSFASFRDPAGRFVLEYPSEWTLEGKGPVRVFSPRIATFAQVEIHPDGSDPWADVEKRILKAGGEVSFATRSPSGARASLSFGGRRFHWSADVHPVKGGSVILSMGNVLDLARSRALERYEDKVLAAIRRRFRILSVP